MTMNSGDPTPRRAGVLVGCDAPNPRPAVPTLREARAAGNTLDVDVDQQLRSESACGDSLPDVPFPNVPLPNVPLPDVPLPDVPLPDVPLPGARPDGSVGEE